MASKCTGRLVISRSTLALVGASLSAAATFAQPPAPPPAPAPPPPPAPEQVQVEERPETVLLLRREAAMLRRLMTTPDATRFLLQTNFLPVVDDITVYRRATPPGYLTQAQFDELSEEDRAGLTPKTFDDYFFYYTRYGSPLAYARALDLVAKEWGSVDATSEVFKGKRIVDFGFGGIGQLRMLGTLGAHVTGIEVDPLLAALYADPKLQGEVTRPSIMDDVPPVGSLQLIYGRWPADEGVAASVAQRGKFDLFISKNTLKRGYITPEKEVDPRMLVDLGMSPDDFIKRIADSLNDNGLVMIYNLCPKQAPEGEPYKPWADGRSPFSRESLEAAGFEIIAFDQDDTAAGRDMGRLLEWDNGPSAMDLDNDLQVWFSLVRKKAAQ